MARLPGGICQRKKFRNCTAAASPQLAKFDRSDNEFYHKTYDLHVPALQKPFIESEGQSPGFISFRALE
jgi:hypothetical protein